MEKNILDMSASEARRFFLKQESFCNIGLPQYFNFQKLLDGLSVALEGKDYSYQDPSSKHRKIISDIWDLNPGSCHDVNYLFLQNKDGRLSWRPLQIINPVLYVCLVREITNENNWETIVERFREDLQSNSKIKCCSMPLVNQSTQTDISNTVLSWWNGMEQQSIELAMEYNYLMKTDISDCYSSIYTHSITWAMCDKEKAKERLQNKRLQSSKDEERYKIGDAIDRFIQDMSYKQTNGIPQGSVLMDFIAELVLGYADRELSERLSEKEFKNKDYRILRYRDDYRIFGITQEDVVKIAKVLTEVLSNLNFRLNTHKTTITQDLVSDSIKSDKMYYLANDYKQLEEPECAYTLQKHLLRIHKLSLEHPNSGSLQKAMNHFFKRVCDWKELDLFKESGSTKVLLSILTNISYNNPKVYREYIAIASKILSYETEAEKTNYIKQIVAKFSHLPNVGILELWLQRLTIKESRRNKYNEPLCLYAAGYKTLIWNFEWLKSDIKEIIERIPIIDKEMVDNLPEVIEYREIEQFNKY
ncbi:MAG: RNA-directed DNA polymerase [Prevotella sp.]|nr:RNA-directed DNA polymerase [Prevotella sp.]